ncbi:MAG: response regulator transcription factor [Planctomycetaceae bacterium]
MKTEPRSTVFLIDDDLDVLDAVTRLLTAVGFSVVPFESAEAFLNATDSESTGCVITDLAMPSLDGLELGRILSDRSPQMPIVIITGHGEVALAVQAMKDGAFDFIEKPFDPDEFIQLVHRALSAAVERQETRQTELLLTRLGTREAEVLELIIEGMPTKAIAARLGSSYNTVRNQRSQILKKMHVTCTAELVRNVTIFKTRPKSRGSNEIRTIND